MREGLNISGEEIQAGEVVYLDEFTTAEADVCNQVLTMCGFPIEDIKHNDFRILGNVIKKDHKKKGKRMNKKEMKERICELEGDFANTIDAIVKLKGGLNEDIRVAHDLTKSIQSQLKCSAKTKGKHKMVYESSEVIGFPSKQKFFTFRCSICGLEITKTEKELSKTEREALKKLGVI